MQSKHTKENKNEDKHILKMWTPLPFSIDENYKFVHTSIIYRFFSKTIYLIVLPILYIYNKIIHGFKIVGSENLWKTVGGKIIVTNHIHPMDCTFVGLAVSPNKIYYPTIEANFKIPGIANLIRLLNAIPIPEKIDAKKKFVSIIDNLLQDGKMVQFYPEGSMWPYYDKLRSFKKGAFDFATHNMVPVIPMVYTYRTPKGFRRIINRKPLITLNILPAVYPTEGKGTIEKSTILMNKVYNNMKEVVEGNKSIKKL